MLFRLFSAELVKIREGNVNLIYCWWVYYEGWLLLGFPVFQPFLLGCVKSFVLLSYSLKIYVTKLTWNYISVQLRQANGSFHAWKNFDFWCLSARLLYSSGITITTDFLNWCKISPAQTFRKTQLELEVEMFFPCNTCLNAWTWCVEVMKNIFALMLYRLFSAACEKQMEGNVNLIYCWWVYYEGWLLLGFPVFQPSLLGCLKSSVLLSCSLKIYVTKLTWNYISLLLGRANGSFHAWNNFDFWCLSARLLSSSGITITTDFFKLMQNFPCLNF